LQASIITGVTNRFYVYLDDATVTPGTLTNLDDATVLANYSSISTVTRSRFCLRRTRGWFADLNAYGTGEQMDVRLDRQQPDRLSINRPTPASVTATSLGARAATGSICSMRRAISNGPVAGSIGHFAAGGRWHRPALQRR
jgi:hypothetical protein